MISTDAIPRSFQPITAVPPRAATMPPEALKLESDHLPLLASPPLSTLADPTTSVLIAVTDATRPSPDRLLLGLLRKELDRAGVPPEKITLLCATGLHRPMSSEEAGEKFGEENLDGVSFINHNAVDPDQIVELGEIDGIPVTVNRRCIEADLLIAVGVVEPHQYAGFSGGSKTVVIGCGGEKTIGKTHGIGMLGRPGTGLASVLENPFQEFVREAGEKIGLRYILNVVLDEEGTIVGGACGDPTAVHRHLCATSMELCRVTIDRPVCGAVVGVPESKGKNLYQASRAATYLALVEGTPLRPGAPIIIPAQISEGAGEGTGERRFFEFLSSTASPEELIERFQREGFPAGAQRAWIVAQTLLKHPIILAGAEHPDVVRACHMIPASDTVSALELAEKIVKERFDEEPGGYPLLLVRNGLTTLPRIDPGLSV